MNEFIVTTRLVHFSATMLLFGASLFKLYAANEISGHIAAAFDRWLHKILLIAAIVSLFSALAWWDALAVYMGDGWQDALNSEVLGAVLFDTEFGKIWIWHLGFCFAVAAVLLIPRGLLSKAMLPVAILSLGVLITLAAVGHATMHEGLQRIFHQSSQIVHLVAAGTWLGGLVPLGYVLQCALRERAWLLFALHALSVFSRVGYFAVSLVLLSGCVMGWQIIGGLSDLFGTAYGRVLLIKVFLFLLMTGVAVLNRFYWMPMLAFGQKGKRKQLMLRQLGCNVTIEQSIGLAVLTAASVLGTLQPIHAG
jgi:copper resistance protein D